VSARQRKLLVITGLAIAALALVAARVAWSSRTRWRDAEARFSMGDTPGAIDRWGRAARLYAPGNPWSERSLARLDAIALEEESRGHAELALSAWRELRVSIRATRSFYTPSRERLARADEHIARLAAASESAALDPGADLATRERWHARQLAIDDAPSVALSLLALAGLLLWLGGALGLLRNALDNHDRWLAGPALRWSLVIAVGFVAFVIGVACA
jgi:hypothetical protein